MALLAASVISGPAAAQSDDPDDLGRASDYGLQAEAAAKIQDGVVSGGDPAPTTFLIELRAAPAIAGGSEAKAIVEQSTFLRAARESGADLQIRQRYSSVWNGVAVQADRADVELAALAEQVVAVYPVYRIEAPEIGEEADTAEPQLASALGMTGVDVAQDTLGLTGEGMRIGIIDTGVDVDHPDLGGAGEPTNGTHRSWRTDKIRYGRDLVGDAYNADPNSRRYNPAPAPDTNPDDCQGHGTHVAGIAAADGDPEAGGVRGVAPGAVLGAYRVFGCEGSTQTDILLGAMEAAYDDGMDVVNMSIGLPFMTWADYPTARAADAMADAGVVMVASVGNNGANGLYAAGAPGVGEKTIGVASFDNVVLTLDAFLVGPDDRRVGFVEATGAPASPSSGTSTLARLAEPGTDGARACTEDGGITADLSGTTVLIERGICGFYEKALNAQQAGAEAIVLYNNLPGMLTPGVVPPAAGDPEITIPVVFVDRDDGLAMSEAVAAGETQLTWSNATVTRPGPNGGLVSAFSSYGLTAELGLKPDLGAPGGNIWSTFPLELGGGHRSISGTSMASPHVAGAAALLLQERPKLTPLEVRDILQNSADPALWSLNPTQGVLEGTFRQGAGMLDLDDAVRSTTTVSPGKLSLGETQPEPHAVTLAVTNHGEESVTYAIGNNSDTAAAGTNTNNPLFALAPAIMDGPTEVTVAPGATATVNLEFTPPNRFSFLYSGWVEFTPAGGGQLLRVPYAGFSGDYQVLRTLTPGSLSGLELPVLGQLKGCDRLVGADCLAGGSWDAWPNTGPGDVPVYSLVDGDVPTALVHLQHPARSLSLTAYRANPDGSQGEEVGVVETFEYLPRSSTGRGFSMFTWDGRWDGEIVPDGKYVLGVSVLKALGDPENPDHTETWVSEPFTIASKYQAPRRPQVDRISGLDRFSTAARVARTFERGVDVAYVALGDNFPDALAGAALAGTQDSPVVLVREGSIPGATRIALEVLQPKEIVVLGGGAAIQGRVLSDLRNYTEGRVTRISGVDRYATAAIVAERFSADAQTVYVASGVTFPDALAGAAMAGIAEGPVLLTRPDALPGATARAIERLNPERIIILGGSAAVSDGVATELAEHAPVERLAGANRYGTASAVAAEFSVDTSVAFVATGESFPDALAGAARAGHLQAPVLLVRPGSVPDATLAQLRRLEPEEIVILGGTGAVSQRVQDQLAGIRYGD